MKLSQICFMFMVLCGIITPVYAADYSDGSGAMDTNYSDGVDAIDTDDIDALYARINGALQEMVFSMDYDVQQFQEWDSTVYGVLAEFDLIDDRRVRLFSKVQQAVMQMSSSLTNLYVELENKQQLINNLEWQLYGSSNSDCVQQIFALQTMVAQLQAQLQELQNEYDITVEMNNDSAIELLESLDYVKQKYYSLMSERDYFVGLVDQLVARVKNYGALAAMDEYVLTELLEAVQAEEQAIEDAQSSLETMACEVGVMMEAAVFES